MEKKQIYWIILLAIALIFFAMFSTKIGFHDSFEYVNMAKSISGVQNINIFVGHSLVYPLIISPFLKIFPSLFVIKLINTLWIFLIALTLLLWLKNEKAFILFAFSPLTWYVSIQTTPILPASFFFLLSFLFFYKNDLKHNKIYSGVLLGFCCAIYTPMIVIGGLFLTINFWSRKFSGLVIYFISLGIGFSPRLILDYYLFGMPFYSLIKYFGANLIVSLGLHSSTKNLQFLQHFEVFLILVAISPFLYKLYKINFNKNKKIILFLLFSFLVFFVRAANIKYFFIISPLIIILLSNFITEKNLKVHCLISIGIIVLLTFTFFGVNELNNDKLIQKDIKNIMNDFNSEYILGGPFESLDFATFSWEERPYFIWWQDYLASLEGKENLREYNFKFNSKIPLNEMLQFSVLFDRFENKTYENFILVTQKTQEEFPELKNFKLKKCYETLCVYTS